jgi:hypothetical protein
MARSEIGFRRQEGKKAESKERKKANLVSRKNLGLSPAWL